MIFFVIGTQFKVNRVSTILWVLGVSFQDVVLEFYPLCYEILKHIRVCDFLVFALNLNAHNLQMSIFWNMKDLFRYCVIVQLVLVN